MPIEIAPVKIAASSWRVLPNTPFKTKIMIGALAGLLLAFPVNANAADKAPPPAYDQSDNDANSPGVINTAHIEGHIAFLHAELGIAPEQEALWKPVADAMRADVQETEDAERKVARHAHGRESAIEYLQNRVMFATLRAQGETRYLNAFQPLYQALSAHQKSVADGLLVSADIDQ